MARTRIGASTRTPVDDRLSDSRYVTELINRHKAGVPVRVLVDQRANASKRLNERMLNMLRDGGIPMRDKYVGDILHFKMMLFHGQNMVEFGRANYTPASFVPIQPKRQRLRRNQP